MVSNSSETCVVPSAEKGLISDGPCLLLDTERGRCRTHLGPYSQPMQTPSHIPQEQCSRGWHWWPHAPQLLASKRKSVPGGQSPPTLLHVPLIQDVPAAQTFPQA